MIGKIAELLGTPLYPAQQYVFDVALEVQCEEAGDPEPGLLAYAEVDDFEPRRAGKTFKLGPLVAHRCGSGARRTAWITAQKRTAAVRRWDAVCAQLLASAALARELHQNTGTNREVLRWASTRSRFLPFTPGGKADDLHGEEPELVIVDELWAHDLTAKSKIEQGYKPAWAINPGQAWLLSAAGTRASAWLNTARASLALDIAADRRLGVCGFVWAVPDEVGGVAVEELPDAELLNVVLGCHPRRDNGLRAAYLAEQLRDMGRADFLRGYGNKTLGEGVRLVIAAEALRRATSRTRIPPRVRVGLGVGVDPDAREAVVSCYWRDLSGVAYGEVVKGQDGTRWVARFVRDLVVRQEPGAVAINYAGAARDVAEELEVLLGTAREDDGVETELLKLSAGQYAAACTRLKTGIEEPHPSVTHRGEKELLDAIKASGRRHLAGGFAWASRGEEPIAALEAHTAALWAADHMPPAASRFTVVGSRARRAAREARERRAAG